MNHCTFSGRLTRDAETRFTQTGKAVTSFAIAVDAGYGERKRTDFINCVMWERQGIGEHLTKGKPIIIAGEYQERRWNDRDGAERRSVEIIVRDIEFQHGQPRQDDQQRPQQQRQQSRPARDDEDLGPPFPSDTSGMSDVPF